MKISRLLKILEDLVALKFSDPKGKHGRRFYRNLHRFLRAFLLQDGLPLKTKLRALTPSMAVYAKVRMHERIVSDDVNNCLNFIVLEIARVLLEADYLKLKENDPSKCLFVQTLQQTKCRLKSSPDERLFEALGNVQVTEWSHPVLLKMLQQEHTDSETIPYAAFIESVENSDIVRLRVRLLLETGCRELANNLISWCVASRMFDCDIYILLQRLNFLLHSGRAEEFHQLCCQISCCTARELVESAKQGTIVSIGRSTLLTMSRSFFLLDWIKATDLSCTRELLKQWVVLEYETLKRERQLALAAFNKVVALAHSTKQLVLFVDVIESQFESEFLTFCSELMGQAIRQERHRLDCARLYRRDAEDVRDATESLVAICRIVGRIYKDHCQMNLSCQLCCLYLDPTVTDFCSLEKEYANLECPPSTEPAPPPNVCATAYRTLLSAVQLLQPESFAVSSSWKELKPVLVTYMEGAGFSYNEAKNRFKSHLKRVEARKRFGSGNGKMWKGMNNADALDGREAKSSGKKEQGKIGNGFVKSSRLKTDLAKLDHVKKELKVGEHSNKRKQNSDEECSGVTSHRDLASSDRMSKKMRRLGSVLPPKQVAQSVSDSSVDIRDVAGESGGENSTDSAAVSEYSTGLRTMSGSEMRRQSLLSRRYVWKPNSSATASQASTSNPHKLSSLDNLPVGKSDKEITCQDRRDSSKNLELRSTCVCSSPDVCVCGGVGSIGSNPCFSTAGKLDKNSNLHVESVDTSNATSLNSSVNGNPSLCSNVVTSRAEVPKVKGRTSLGEWETKFLAYCSVQTSESEVESEKFIESVTVATATGTVATTDLTVATTELGVVTSTLITSVPCASLSTTVMSSGSVTVESGTNPSQSDFLQRMSSPKVACISENQTSCSTKSSECRLRHSSTLDLAVEGTEPSVSTVTESHVVQPYPTTVEDFRLIGSAPVMTDTCQSSNEAVTPALDGMVSGSTSAAHSKGTSSDGNSGSTVSLPSTSEVESCEKLAPSTDLFAETIKELSTTSGITCDISETSVAQSLCTRKITSPSTQGAILQPVLPVSSCTLKLDTVATDSPSFVEPVTAVSPSLARKFEKPVPQPVNASTRNLIGSFLNEPLNGEPEVETASSVCSRNEEGVMTSIFTSLDSHSDCSSRSTHPSFTSLPAEAMPVVVATASGESLTSRVTYSCVPVMSVMEEVWSASVEPQADVLADSVTYAVYKMELDSVVPVTTTDTMPSIIDPFPAASTPDSAAGFQQASAIIADEISQAESSPHDITASGSKMHLDTPDAAGGVSVSNTSLVPSRGVMEMLDAVGQTVTCSKTKQHSAKFVEKLWKMLKPSSETSPSSRSPASSRGSDFAEMSAELDAAARNESPEDCQNGNAVVIDGIIIEELSESPGPAETSGNNVLNDPHIDPSHDHAGRTDCDGYEKACSTKASVSKNSLAVRLDNCIETDDSQQKLPEAGDQAEALDLRTYSTPTLETDVGHVEIINVETDSALDLRTDIGMVNIGTNSTPNLQTDGAQTDQAVDGQVVDMSIFNAPENEQQLLLYNSLRQEQERNQDRHHMLAAIRFDNTTVPVSPTNLFYYERACPKVRDVLKSSSPHGFGAETKEGDMPYDTKNVLNLGQGLEKGKSVDSPLTVLDGGCTSDGCVKGGESLYDGQEIHAEPVSCEEKIRSEVQGLVQDNSGEGQESLRDSCCKEGQGHVGDDSNKAQGVSMEPVASGEKLKEDQSTGGEKLSKGKRSGVENSRKARGRNSGKCQSPGGESSVKVQSPKVQSPIEESPSVIPGASSGDRAVCILCGKSLSSDRGLRMHLIKLHEMDVVNRQAPEDGYRCRLCDRHWKLLSVCTCRQKSTGGKTGRLSLSSDKPSTDSSENFTSCRKKKARLSNDRKVSLDGNGDHDRSAQGKIDSQRKDRCCRGKSTSQSKEKSNSQNMAVANHSKVSNQDDDGGTEGSNYRLSRKRLFCGAKKNADNSSTSSVKKRGAAEHLDGAERSSVRQSQKRLFDDGDSETTDDSPLLAHRKSNVGEDSGRVHGLRARRPPDVKVAQKSSQKRWQLRDRLNVKTV